MALACVCWFWQRGGASKIKKSHKEWIIKWVNNASTQEEDWLQWRIQEERKTYCHLDSAGSVSSVLLVSFFHLFRMGSFYGKIEVCYFLWVSWRVILSGFVWICRKMIYCVNKSVYMELRSKDFVYFYFYFLMEVLFCLIT